MTTEKLHTENLPQGAVMRVDTVDFDIFGGGAEPALPEAETAVIRTASQRSELDFDLVGDGASAPDTATVGFRTDDCDRDADDATRFATSAIPPKRSDPRDASPLPSVAGPPPATQANNLPLIIVSATAVAALVALVWWFLR